jgi:3-methyladenine DNA glycosylase AlkD
LPGNHRKLEMNSVSQVLKELEKKGSEQTRKTFARHGISLPMFGVLIADLKTIAKKIKGNQKLALELYETGNYDAMYLAGLVADGKQMSKPQLERWAKNAKCHAISAYTVAWMTTESPHARELAMKWISAKNESLAVSGWNVYSGIVATTADYELDLDEIRKLLSRIAKEIHTAPNMVRYTMNGFVIAVGGYIKPLAKEAKKVAAAIGEVSVDMGDTACKVPLASAYLEKIGKAGKIGVKRKTMRC